MILCTKHAWISRTNIKNEFKEDLKSKVCTFTLSIHNVMWLSSFQEKDAKLDRFLSKNQHTHPCASKLVSLNKKNKTRILMIFDIENWIWNSDFCPFWQPATMLIEKMKYFPWSMYYPILCPFLENWTTHINISNTYVLSLYDKGTIVTY